MKRRLVGMGGGCACIVLVDNSHWERHMNRRCLTHLLGLSVVCLGLLPWLFAQSAETPNWVATWGAAMQQPSGTGYNNQTARMFMRSTIGGKRARVRLSNTFGSSPLAIGAARLAVHGKGSAIVAGSDRELKFEGKLSVTIPPGASVTSDPVNLDIAPLADLAVSVYAPGPTGPATRHSMALRTGYIGAGNQTGVAELTGATTMTSWLWVSAIEVDAPADARAIVALGASSVDGATSTVDTNRSWPSVLAERLQANPATRNISVINMGISGNKVLSDTPTAGVSALARFDRDVLQTAGVGWLMIFEGTNDIGGVRQNPASASTAQLTTAYKELIERARKREIKVIGCTLNPFEGASYFSEPGEAIRLEVNAWIRKQGSFDAAVDFEAVTRDSSNPRRIRQVFNNGDSLHPNDAGYKAMADSINLALFSGK
jgi:lysophospholipase L1-like esterase